MPPIEDAFYVVAHEAGHGATPLPTWADRRPGNVTFNALPTPPPSRRDIPDVPGAFHLLDVLTDDECARFIAISDALGYHEDAPISLPHRVRHNTNVNWVVHESIDGPIWARCAPLIPERMDDEPAVGLNARFRFYRYERGDYFQPHTDGAWPGSRVIDGKLVDVAYRDRFSQMTMLLFLSDGYVGGRTLFYLGPNLANGGIGVSTPKGAALCFPHGPRPDHCLHAGEPVERGVKYIIRTDVLFRYRGAEPAGR